MVRHYREEAAAFPLAGGRLFQSAAEAREALLASR
jgi:hypothetical protein